MKIVIDIPESIYNDLYVNNSPMYTLPQMDMYYALKNGIILPSKHGRLIDERDLLGRLEIYNTKDEMDQAHYRFTKAFIACTPAVIPANKKSEDKE